jgi:5-methyltetrahydropteroyltriglutamate--homocysteine methyltransferase
MNRSKDRILITHTGSLPRPDGLAEPLAAFDAGSLGQGERATLAARVSNAVTRIVARQAGIGIDVVSDGEMSKFSYTTYVKQRVTGFEGASEPLTLSEFADFPGIAASGTLRVPNPSCVGPVTFRGGDAVAADVANLKSALQDIPEVEGFMNAASPGIIADYFHNEYYGTDEEYLWALAKAMKPEYDMIAASGLVLQIDCPDLALGRHFAPKPLAVPAFRARIAQRVDALNHALRDIPPERIRMHICWGNYPSPHHHDIPLHEIADVVLRARPAALLIEAANPRHSHEWRVFEDLPLPEGKILVPGVIDTLSTYVEHPRVIADRILRYARTVGRENVIAGTDCGFATFADSTPVDPDIGWAKLRALAEGAEIASRELWSTAHERGRAPVSNADVHTPDAASSIS